MWFLLVIRLWVSVWHTAQFDCCDGSLSWNFSLFWFSVYCHCKSFFHSIWVNVKGLISLIFGLLSCSPWIQPPQGCRQVPLANRRDFGKHWLRAAGVMHLMASASLFCWPRTLQFRYLTWPCRFTIMQIASKSTFGGYRILLKRIDYTETRVVYIAVYSIWSAETKTINEKQERCRKDCGNPFCILSFCSGRTLKEYSHLSDISCNQVHSYHRKL